MLVASAARMHKAAIRLCLVAALLTVVPGGRPASAQLGILNWLVKLDPLLQPRASLLTGRSRIIVRTADATSLRLLTPIVQLVGGTLGPTLPIINGLVADLPTMPLPLTAS